MKAIVMTFNGPRSAELIEAEDRAGRDRLGPTILAHPRMRDEFVNMTVLRQPDGREQIVLTTAATEAASHLLREIVTSSELLPGEDVSLLPGPDTRRDLRRRHGHRHARGDGNGSDDRRRDHRHRPAGPWTRTASTRVVHRTPAVDGRPRHRPVPRPARPRSVQLASFSVRPPSSTWPRSTPETRVGNATWPSRALLDLGAHPTLTRRGRARSTHRGRLDRVGDHRRTRRRSARSIVQVTVGERGYRRPAAR